MWSPTDLNKTLEIGKQLSKEMSKQVCQMETITCIKAELWYLFLQQ